MEQHAQTLQQLQANPKNPRTITDKKRRMLEQALKKFGDLGGIVRNQRSGNLVGGHQRVEAFKVLGAGASIVIERSYNPPTKVGTTAEGYVELAGERFAYRETDWAPEVEAGANLAANKGAGEWSMEGLADMFGELSLTDMDLDLTMFDANERDSLMPTPEPEPEVEVDEDFEEAESTDIVLGDKFVLGKHLLHCGDSTNFEAVRELMGEDKAPLIFTDPPYNYAGQNGIMAADIRKASANLRDAKWDVDFNFEDVANNLLAYMADDASIYVCTSQHIVGAIMTWMKAWSDYFGYVVWIKPSPMPSLRKRHWTWATELICYATRGKHTFNFPAQGHALSYWNIERNPGGNKEHPTMKPTALPAHAIEHSSAPGDVVLDLFGGAGSTLLACEQLGRRARLMELSPKHCQTIINRWEKLSGEKARRVGGELAED